jgi:hypothetical protein
MAYSAYSDQGLGRLELLVKSIEIFIFLKKKNSSTSAGGGDIKKKKKKKRQMSKGPALSLL